MNCPVNVNCLMLPDRNTIKLLRIPFSFYLMPLFLFAVSQVSELSWSRTLFVFLIIHLLVYPASNGYNSYIDRDEGSIGGLEKPPMPTKNLFYLTLLMDFLAISLSVVWVDSRFGFCILLYILASRAYSSRTIRLKKYAIPGFLIVVIFQGAFTYYMSVLGITGQPLALQQETIWLLLGCSFQIAGAYPLTQIYQHQQDLSDGVMTISYKLGYRGTFVFTALMFLLCNLCYYLYFSSIDQISTFFIVQIFFLPIVLYFGYWFYQVSHSVSHANFKNTMRMNQIAAVCMNGCFLVLIVMNHLL